MQSQTFKTKGMSCASCAHHIEKALKKMPGVQSCDVNFATECTKITFDESTIDLDVMNKVVEPMGYQLIGNKQTQSHSMSD